MTRTGRPPKYDYVPRAGRVVIDPAKLKYWRTARLLSPADLAELIYVSERTMRAYERGEWCPDERRFRKIITVLGVGPEDLLFEGSRYIPANPLED